MIIILYYYYLTTNCLMVNKQDFLENGSIANPNYDLQNILCCSSIHARY